MHSSRLHHGVHVPRLCHPLFCPSVLRPYRYTVFAPVNPLRNVTETVIDRLVPEPDTEDPVPFSVHWLFCTLPEDPAGTDGDIQPLPVSLARKKLLLPLW
jgi:hypothetical protein